ncbi:MAG: hypothetical protein LBU89_00830 [Fibromonadaceae bacterium]|jgi:uncharacterized membrane protein|nr:hypothetical protein [Fibromonadaceae bacterium]
MERQQQMQARTDGGETAVGIMVQESLLPVPEELAKFKEIEPAIVSWMMQYADKEQDMRIKFNLERLNLTKGEQNIVRMSLWLAFAVAALFMVLSGILIYSGLEIAGTIFGGLALVLCVQAFLKFGRNQKQ